MSLYGALRVGVSGLFSQSQAVSSASDNIANANTVGYKATRTRFATMVTSQGSGNSFSPGGVTTLTRREIGQQGLIQTTNNATDVAVSGSGFFTVTDKLTRNIQTGEYEISGNVYYTRAGEFRPDVNGNLQNPQGYYLVGWPQNDTNTGFNRTNVHNAMRGLNVSSQTTVPIPSTDVFVSANLNAQAANNSTFDITTQVFDRQGSQRNLQMIYTRLAPNTWSVGVSILGETSFRGGVVADEDSANLATQATKFDATDRIIGNPRLTDINPVTTGRSEALPATVAILSFNDNGTLRRVIPMDGSALTGTGITNIPDGAGGVQTNTFHRLDVNTGRTPAGTTTNYRTSFALNTTNAALNNGVRFFASYDNDVTDGTGGAAAAQNLTAGALGFADNVQIDLRFGTIGATDGLTQFDGANSINFFTQNGRQFGSLTSITFATDGTASATFSNGDTRGVAQIPVTTFTNPNGLTALNGNVYTESSSSGAAIAHIAGTGGAGSVSASALEQSTVDLAKEFTELIIAQT